MKCTAHKTDGEPCNAWAIKGGNVCRVHGGSAPQVKAKASERLALARDDALALLVQQIDAGSVEPAVALNAVVKLTETIETLEGRMARREEHVSVEHPELDREIKRLMGELGGSGEARAARGASGRGLAKNGAP